MLVRILRRLGLALRAPATIATETSSHDFFGIAYGREDGRLQRFHDPQSTMPIIDGVVLLIDPKAASAFAANLAQKVSEREAQT